MRFGLPSFLGRFLGSPQRTEQKHKARSHRRKLAAEPLESRFALSTLDGGVTVSDEPAILSDPVPSLVASPTTVELPLSQFPPDPPANTPPVIHDLTITQNGNWFIVSGWVSDNVDPTGYTVQISGTRSGLTLVAGDDHFSFAFQADPSSSGVIYAQTQDMQGLLSNVAMASF